MVATRASILGSRPGTAGSRSIESNESILENQGVQGFVEEAHEDSSIDESFDPDENRERNVNINQENVINQRLNNLESLIQRLIEQGANGSNPATVPGTNPSQPPTQVGISRRVVSYCPEENRLDPMTSKGQKLILEISKPSIETGKTLSITQKNGDAILKHVIALTQKIDFRSALEIEVNGEKRSILRNYDCLSVEAIKEHNFSSVGCWGYDGQSGMIPNAVSIGDDLFDTNDESKRAKARRQLDLRTRNQILQRYVSNLCDPSDLERIKIRFASVLEVKNPDDVGSKMIDGAVLLKLVLDKCSPSTLSKIDNIKTELSNMKMSDYEDNVENLLDAFESKLQMILDMGGQVEEKYKYLFRALQTSTNEDFNQDIRTMRMRYYRGEGKSFPDILRAANDLYKNMKADEVWGKKSEKDIKIAALTTKLSTLTELTKVLVSKVDESKKPKGGTSDSRADWKFVFKGDSIDRDGKTYFWCPDPSHNKTKEQKIPGMYCISHGNGSGVSHEESRKAGANKRNSSDKDSEPPKSDPVKDSGKLSLSEKLKTAISSHMTISSEDLDAILDTQEN